MPGISGKPIDQKLGIQPGFCILTVGAPATYAHIVGKLPAGVTITREPKAPLGDQARRHDLGVVAKEGPCDSH